MGFFADTGMSGATVFYFTAYSDTRLDDLEFIGFTTGTIQELATAIITTYDDTSTWWHNSNSIFNEAHNWNIDEAATISRRKGHEGATPTASPASSCNVPDAVSTLNKFDNINAVINTIAFDFVGFTDTETVTNATIFLNSNSARMVQIGNMNGTCPGNNYVNGIHVQGVAALRSPATAIKVIQFGNWTFGNVFNIIPDNAPSLVTEYTTESGVTQAFYESHSGNYNSLLSIGGFGTTARLLDANATYLRLASGAVTQPTYGFNADRQTGFYLASTGTVAFTSGGSGVGHVVFKPVHVSEDRDRCIEQLRCRLPSPSRNRARSTGRR